MKLINITKKYESQNTRCVALQNISLEFDDKGLVLITGRSGSGKTTLLNLLSGLDEVTEGRVINDYPNDNYYSIVFQDFQLIDYLTIEENLKLVCELYGDYSRYDQLISKYDIENILKNYPNQISGGQKQRVAIIRAILVNKPVLLCDEPTGNLDEENALIVANMLKEESKDRLVIVATHDLEIFDSLYDRRIHLSNGKIDYDEGKSCNEIIKYEYNSPQLNFKLGLSLMKKFLNKNKLRFSFLIVSLLLSFLLLISSINLFCNRDYAVINNIYKESGISSINFSRYDEKTADYYSLSHTDIDFYMNKYNCNMYYYDLGISMSLNNTIISRIYVTDYVDIKLLYGNQGLKEKDIIISDYNASRINSDINSLIGTQLGNFNISGIFETNYKDYDLNENAEYHSVCYAVYMSKSSLKYLNYEWVYASIENNNENYKDIVVNNNKEYNALYGEYSNLKLNEIALSSSVASIYADNLDELIGKAINIKFKNYLQRQDNSNVEYIEREFIVKYIYNTSNLIYSINLSTDSYDVLSPDISMTLNYKIANGISINNYNTKIIKEILDLGFKDSSHLTYKIESGYDWVYNLSLISLSIGIITYIISFILIINFVHMIYEKEKRTQGVLVSFGINKNKVSFLYYIMILLAIFVAYLVDVFMNIMIIFLLNILVKKLVNISLNIIYYNLISLLFSIIPIIIQMVITYFVINKKMKNKNVIDIIYER
ncbi:MAG: ATP-binding cassette domain-containing protein [Anaeroplasmataceae bacterium]